MPRPDLTFFLDIDPWILSRRVGAGLTFEEISKQQRLRENIKTLSDSSWVHLEGEKFQQYLAGEIFTKVVKRISEPRQLMQELNFTDYLNPYVCRSRTEFIVR